MTEELLKDIYIRMKCEEDHKEMISSYPFCFGLPCCSLTDEMLKMVR